VEGCAAVPEVVAPFVDDIGSDLGHREVHQECRLHWQVASEPGAGCAAAGEAAEFKEKDPATNLLYYATVGPQDCLSLPAGWFFAEKVSTVDTFGVRVQRLRSADLDTLDKLNVIFMGQNKPNEILQAAIDLLTLAVV